MFLWYKFLHLVGNAIRKLCSNQNYSNVATLAAIIMVGIYADRQNQKVAMQDIRSDVRAQINLIRTKLEGNINGNIRLVRGLISTLQTEPKMDQERFSELAASLFDDHSQLRNIAAAPNLVISLMYPMKGNEKAIGLDYRKNANQRIAAMQVRDRGHVVLAGPVNLVQGGKGFIGRFPVYTFKDNNKLFWGIVSAVIDVNQLYMDSGLLEADLPIKVALLGNDAKGIPGAQFFGSKSVMVASPELADVKLPNGSWQIAAIPKQGWSVISSHIWYERMIIVVVGLFLFFPVAVAGRLADQRKKSYNKLRKREEQLEHVSKRLELALDVSNVGVWEMNLSTGELVWDDRMNELYKLPCDEVSVYQDWENSLHPDDLERAKRDFQTSLDNKSRYYSDFRIVWNSGEVRNIRAIGAVNNDFGGSPRIIGVNWDVTADVALNDDLRRAKLETDVRNAELVQAKLRNEHIALHDSLTGIPNRRFLDNYLAETAEKDDQGKSHAALLIIDLDRFKQINDTFGHAAGDALLVHVSQILKTCVDSADVVARIGGDEFVIVCSSSPEHAHLVNLASTIIKKMRRSFIYNGSECRFGVSIGISNSGSANTDTRQLLINADLALYSAKNQGRNRFEFFSKALHINSMRNKKIADEIQRGIELKEFIPFYQPQFDAKTHSVVGVEALARWNHPELGLLSPDKFLEIATEINVTSAIDHIILSQTLVDFERWSKLGLHVPKASVNVSLHRLRDEELLMSLKELNIRPGTLSFELVESIFLDDNDDIIVHNIDRIKEMGIDIEIDDFGTGHTSIVSLLKLEPTRLKIDRQLVIPAMRSDATRNLLESIIEIGRSLNIETVAEGVESVEHAILLRELGCDFLQGYAFAKPMCSTELERYLGANLKLSA